MGSTIKAGDVTSNLYDYQKARESFSWDQAEALFTWAGGRRMNIVHEAVDRWTACARDARRRALVWDDSIMVRTYSFEDARAISCRWANLLAQVGLGLGGRVLTLLPPGPEVIWVQLAAARLGAAYCHLRPGLSTAVYRSLIQRLRPDVVVTTAGVGDFPWELAPADCAMVYLRGLAPGRLAREYAALELLPQMPDRLEPAWVERDHMLQIVHAENPEGPPRLVWGSVESMVGYLISARWALNLRPDSLLLVDGHTSGTVFSVYGVWGAWLCGAASLLLTGPFSAERWRGALRHHKVSVWYTMPPFLRRLRAAGDRPGEVGQFAALEHLATVGNRLEMEEFFWTRNNFGRPPHQTWWTVETGMIAVANFPSMDLKLGSSGRPMPGLEVKVLDGEGRPAHLLTIGDLALKAPWPAMAHGFIDDDEAYLRRFRAGRWLQTGDMAAYDEDGYIYLQGRQDDLIRGVGRMVGPFEVEQALAADPRVAEAVAVASALPDGQPALKAFVVAAPGQEPDDELRAALLEMLSRAISPDGPVAGLEFLPKLPRNAQGRLIRRALRALDLGLPLGDVGNLKSR